MEGSADIETHGFPPGYFIIRSVANGRVFDVKMDDIEDGTEITLWPEKEKSLVESRRDPHANNQVFFIDTSGALCSRSAGHALDIEGDRLVLRHRRPVSYPFPNSYAHPLPQFLYVPKTGEIQVVFPSDPTYPPPSSNPSTAWKSETYKLASIPLRKPRSVFDDASAFISSAVTAPFSFLSGLSTSPKATPEEIFNGDIDLQEDDILDEDKEEEAEVDDSPEAGRSVRMFAQNKNAILLSEKAQNRRRWQIYPLRTADARTGGL